jgi:hypothetical protein
MSQLRSRVPVLDPELRLRIDRELESGEKLIWASQPSKNVYRRQSWLLVIFGIPFTAFSIVWMLITLGVFLGFGPGKNAGLGVFMSCFALFGVPFVLIGTWMLTAPYWYGRKAARTIYAITDRRAIVSEGRLFSSSGATVQSFLPERLTSMIRNERGDGSGDLIFEEFTTRRGSGHTTTRRGFIGLLNVRDAEDVIRKSLLDAQRGSKTPTDQ